MHQQHASAKNLKKTNRVRHAFLSRAGGISKGIYAGLNCGPGSDDISAHVAENRSRATRLIGASSDQLRTLYQVHSATVIDAETIDQDNPPRADALVCSRPDLVIGVLAADCAPVLFAEPGSGIVAAAHAGWRGSLNGVIEATVDAMVERGADRSNIVAAIGPCIGPQSYEVGSEFSAPFEAQDPSNVRFFAERSGSDRLLFDLPNYVASRLVCAGIISHAATGQDTYGDENFFSYRRSCHRNEADYGRNLSLIKLNTAA